MGNRAAVVRGTFMRPGVSKNKRLYTAEAIARAVGRMQKQLNSEDGLPLTMATSHGAAYLDDALSLVGRVTAVRLNEDGSAAFEADIANTTQGRDVAQLVSGDTPFLKAISIRGEWLDDVQTVEHEGQKVTTASDFKVSGIDFTSRPGVAGATIDDVEVLTESERLHPNMILESFDEFEITEELTKPEATISVSEFKEKFSEFINSMDEIAEADTTPYGDVSYADPGYQADKKKRYPIDTEAHVRAAWSYINQSDNASVYSSAQLKRIKSRIKSAAKKYNINIQEEYNTFLNELQEIVECWVGITVDNGPANITVNGKAADPTQLRDLINQLAMTATAALTVLDPDQDGDIDNVDKDDVDYEGSDSEGMEAEVMDDNNMDGTVVTHDNTAMFCPSCTHALPDAANYCPGCGVAAITKTESVDSAEMKEALVADTENVTEEVTDEATTEAPARLLTDADLQALAMVTAEAVKAVMATTQVKEEEEAPEADADVEDEAPVAEPEAEVEVEAAESTQEGDVAEYSAEDVKKAVAEALDSFKSEVAEAYRDNGAPRKGLVTTNPIDAEVAEEYTAESLAAMGTRDFREAQHQTWGDVPFFQSLWARASAGYDIQF